MPEKIEERDVFSLLEVTKSIQKTLSERYQSIYWVKAEMIKLHYYPHSGHCYPELAEKKDGQVIAQMKANLWREDFKRINNKFQETLKEPLKDGIQILFSAKITYDPVYGLSLQILDIDPSFSLGELEKEKRATIDRLKKEGVFNKNKSLRFPLLPQRIAIISVDTSKGYADFMKVIEFNAWGYRFFCQLFPSVLQGDKAITSITYQLRRIKKVIRHFDVVAIIRGGGGDVGLSCYNNYELSREIALFPIPVITGIGHSTNETVTEMIAYQNAITPTELADFLIQKFHNFSVPVKDATKLIIEKSKRIINDEKIKLQSEVKYFRSVSGNMLIKNQNQITNNIKTIALESKYILKKEKELNISSGIELRKEATDYIGNKKQEIKYIAGTIKKDTISELEKNKLIINQKSNQIIKGGRNGLVLSNLMTRQLKERLIEKFALYIRNEDILLSNLEKSVSNMSPENVLRRGYSITMINGKAVKSHEEVKEGDILKTMVYDGSIESEVKSINKSDKL